MLVTCEEMQRLEKDAFARGVSAADLMEQAGLGIARIVRQFHPVPASCLAFCGKGNNAGDALVALRQLRQWGWRISADLSAPPDTLTTLAREHYLAVAPSLSDSPDDAGPLVILDGLLGIGAAGAPRGAIAAAIDRLNALRLARSAWVLALDLPSGLDGKTGRPHAHCVTADATATIAFPKQCLVADEASNAVGRLALVPLPALGQPPSSPSSLAVPPVLRSWLPLRPFETHKGKYGRIGIIAGSSDFPGAARLASAAAVKAGGGLVTLYVKGGIRPVLASACIPEVMVREVRSFREILDEPADILAAGPGLGPAQGNEVLALVRDASQPMIVDADALNALSHDISLLSHCRGPRLLTPHPGEMERLFPREERTRAAWLDDFLRIHPVTLLLKGSRTLIGNPDGQRFYNSTGNPGMASGGMGDVLTGTCAALAAQCTGEPHEALYRAAVLGAWLCGRAAEQAVFSPGGSPESLSAWDVVSHLGSAFTGLRTGY